MADEKPEMLGGAKTIDGPKKLIRNLSKGDKCFPCGTNIPPGGEAYVDESGLDHPVATAWVVEKVVEIIDEPNAVEDKPKGKKG